jgi:chromosome segregation ATPase
MGIDALGTGAAGPQPGYRRFGRSEEESSNGSGAPVGNGAPVWSEAIAAEVHQLLEASEAAGRAIRDRAVAEAESLREKLRREAEQARREAATRAQREVAQAVGESLRRLMAKAARLDESISELRAEANRLAVDLSELDERVASPEPGARPETDDERRGRLIALTMAINGASRDETASYLADNLDIRDVDSLLDAAYG